MAKKNGNLNAARGTKNDEFYTPLDVIEDEVSNYKIHFKDAVICCPCDESEHTNFYKHFMMKLDDYKWKKLICIGYRENRPAEAHIVTIDENGNEIEENISLMGNGDFRNKETLQFLNECDVVVTNPPFSLFRQFLPLIQEMGKKHLLIGNINAFKYQEIIPYIKREELWTGYTYPKRFLDMKKNLIDKKFGNICWFTNMDIPKRKVTFDTDVTYEYGMSNGWYQKYDNYDAINVNEVCQMPMDYEGVMGLPITYIFKHNPEEYKIIGVFNGFAENDEEKGLIAGELVEFIDKDGKVGKTKVPVVDKKAIYSRVLIQKISKN